MPKSGRATILLLEDERVIMDMFKSALVPTFEVLTAPSVADALEQFRRLAGEIDVLVADLTIPDGSGIHVAWECSSLSPKLRTVIISGYPPSMWHKADLDDFHDLQSKSITLLQKPFLPTKLLEVLNDLIRRPEHPSKGELGAGISSGGTAKMQTY